MVATRRAVRVSSPSKTQAEMSSDVQATPSTGRRTRRTAKRADSPTQHALLETSSQLEKCEGGAPSSPPASLLKRCTRASRLHSPEQPCTPVGSTHEADQSDMESCCSAISDVEPPKTRTRGRKRVPRTASQEEDEVSEVESCSSAVSAVKGGQSVRRSTRKKTTAETTDSDQVESQNRSVVSDSKRVTRSERKTRSRSSKQQTEESELSDAGSCTSTASGVSKSTVRRSTRSRRQTGPIPFHLEEASGSSPRTLRTRAAREKSEVSEPPSCDSEGFESGPTYCIATRRRGKAAPDIVDSDSELTDVHSPVGSPSSALSKGTPSSSRTNSGSSSRGTRTTRHSNKDLSVVREKTAEPVEEETPLDDSRLESTVVAEDGDCTLLEEDTSQTPEERKEDEVKVIPEEDCIVIEDHAVPVEHQQEEPSAESEHVDTSGMETVQETEPSSTEPEHPGVTETLPEATPETTEESGDKDMEAADVDAEKSQAEETVEGAVVVETRPIEEEEGEEEEEEEEEEEKMEVSMLSKDAQQVVEVESIQVTSNEQQKITVDAVPETPADVTVQKTKIISLLDSSEDEEEEEGDEEEEEEEEEEEKGEEGEEEEEDMGHIVEKRGGPSKPCESEGASVKGLFMIDTRPGEEADQHYYKERLTEEDREDEEGKVQKEEGAEQGEEDEEFVDEEGSDDDDDDAMVLFSSRDPHLKDLSSRIDPGIRMKELGGLYINFDGSKSKPVSGSLQKLKEKKIQDEVMKKSVMGPDFEKKDAVPPYSESKQASKLKHRAEREKTTGDSWFNMKAPEITQELKGDLQVLRMRGSMDPKRFYKKNDRDGFPKYFQVATVVDSPVDFYHSRVPKKDRKRTMVEELMADAEFRQNNKRKYQNILAEKAAQGAGRRHKKNKFHKK